MPKVPRRENVTTDTIETILGKHGVSWPIGWSGGLREHIARQTVEAQDPTQLESGRIKINREAWERFIKQSPKATRIEQASPMARPSREEVEDFEQDPEQTSKYLTKPPGQEKFGALGQPNMKDIATKKLGLNEQEQFLYQHHLDNYAKGGVPSAGGKTSSLLAITVGDKASGKTSVIPTIWDNKIVSQEQAIKNAEAAGWDKFPAYGSHEEAFNRYSQMHDYMDKDMQ
jgi:hypothetical protein